MVCHIYIYVFNYLCLFFFYETERIRCDFCIYIWVYIYIHMHIRSRAYTHICVCTEWPVLDDIFGRMVADITLDSSQNKWSRELATLKPILQSVTLWWFVSVCFWKLQFSSLIYLWKVGNFPMFFLSLIWNFPNEGKFQCFPSSTPKEMMVEPACFLMFFN